jgi:hypothetical protein
MHDIYRPLPIAIAIKRLSLGVATTALLTSVGLAQALEVKMGGYVKTDVTYDTDQDLGPSLAASGITTSTGNTDSDPAFRMHSLQSRFNITATEGPLKTFVEGDFFVGSSGNELVSNSRHFRLRHAYGQVGNLLIGQTWSTFMDKNWVLYPSTVDFGGPAGATFIRQTQIRWSMDNGLDIAIENPENRIVESGTTSVVGIVAGAPAVVTEATSTNVSRDTIPDIIVRYSSKGDFSWQVAALFQKFEAEGGTADGQTETNIGLTAGAAFNIGKGSISAKVNSNSNRYSYYGFSNPAAVVSGGNIETIDHTAFVVAYNHNWGGTSNGVSTFAFGTVDFDDNFLAASDIETVSTFHANYRWNPYENVTFGVEVSSAEREDINGADGDNTRLQFGAQFSL